MAKKKLQKMDLREINRELENRIARIMGLAECIDLYPKEDLQERLQGVVEAYNEFKKRFDEAGLNSTLLY